MLEQLGLAAPCIKIGGRLKEQPRASERDAFRLFGQFWISRYKHLDHELNRHLPRTGRFEDVSRWSHSTIATRQQTRIEPARVGVCSLNVCHRQGPTLKDEQEARTKQDAQPNVGRHLRTSDLMPK